MSRLFTFGCSFTKYVWPTWADILSEGYKEFQNWGNPGAGNHFIFYSLVEAIKRNNINKDDTVAIMWTSVGREDRYIKGQWVTPGSIYNSIYPQEYIDKLTDPDGYMLQTALLITATNQILTSIGCNSIQLKSVPFDLIDDSILRKLFQSKMDKDLDNLFNAEFLNIAPSMMEVIQKADWAEDTFRPPCLLNNALTYLESKYENCKGEGWPSFEDFLLKKNIKEFQNEMENDFKLITELENFNNGRLDQHRSTIEHYYYLRDVGFELDSAQHDFAVKWDESLKSNPDFVWKNQKINRF